MSDLRRLQVAFAFHMTREVLEVDSVVHPQEVRFLERAFPEETLRELGFVDADGRPTPALAEAAEAALLELPERLTLGEKLALLESLVEASAADGQLAAEEADALAAAARMLGIPADSWADHVAGLLASGALVRDASGE